MDLLAQQPGCERELSWIFKISIESHSQKSPVGAGDRAGLQQLLSKSVLIKNPVLRKGTTCFTVLNAQSLPFFP